MRQNIYDDKKFSDEYDKMRNENSGINANDVIEIPIFRRMLPDLTDKFILDLGCGYGENDVYFIEHGAKYVMGTDISEHMISIANNNYKKDAIDYKVLAMEDISKIDKKFDVVVSSLAFHYIKDYDKLILDIYNLLNDNGYLIFSMEHPLSNCIIYDNDLCNKHITIGKKKYILLSDYNREGKRICNWFNSEVIKYHRTMATIINTLVKNGFKIEEINECLPNDEMISKNSKYTNQYDYPYFLFVKVKK